MLRTTKMMMRALLVLLCLSGICAGCSSLPTPCPPQASATGTGSTVSQAEARVTWKSGGCSGHPQ
jgi:hypothetical protein